MIFEPIFPVRKAVRVPCLVADHELGGRSRRRVASAEASEPMLRVERREIRALRGLTVCDPELGDDVEALPDLVEVPSALGDDACGIAASRGHGEWIEL